MEYPHGQRAKRVRRRRLTVPATALMGLKARCSKLCNKESMIELHLIDAGN